MLFLVNLKQGYVNPDTILQTVRNLRLTLYPGGIPASLVEEAQQWDYPNSWAPSQWFIIEGLRLLDSNEVAVFLDFSLLYAGVCYGSDTSRDLAQHQLRWLECHWRYV